MSKSGKGKGPTDGKYIVGRGRPPKQSQWQPGQSGNAGGRRVGSHNKQTIWLEIEKCLCSASVKLRGESGVRDASSLEAYLITLKKNALAGIPAAMRLYKEFLDQAPPAPTCVISKETIEEDDAILQWYKEWNASRSEDPDNDVLEEADGNADEDPV